MCYGDDPSCSLVVLPVPTSASRLGRRLSVWMWGPLAADEKEDMIHELDAVVSHLYGLNESQVVHIFETFHEGWDYEARLNGVRRHFRAWKNR